jgi:hypothetical protein
MLTDESKLVKRTEEKLKERVIVSRHKEKARQGNIEQKHMPIESNKTKQKERFSFYTYIFRCTTRLIIN